MRPQARKLAKNFIAWQEWIWAVLQELQAASFAAGMLTWELFFRHLASYLKEQKGYSSLLRLQALTELFSIGGETDDAYNPTLETILKFCYVCQVTPLQVMNGQLSTPANHSAGTELRSPLPRRQHQRVDRERCQMALQAALDGREEPLALYQVARRLGYEARQLAYHFPEECTLVTQRARDYRNQRKAQRLAQVRENIQQAVLSRSYPRHLSISTQSAIFSSQWVDADARST